MPLDLPTETESFFGYQMLHLRARVVKDPSTHFNQARYQFRFIIVLFEPGIEPSDLFQSLLQKRHIASDRLLGRIRVPTGYRAIRPVVTADQAFWKPCRPLNLPPRLRWAAHPH